MWRSGPKIHGEYARSGFTLLQSVPGLEQGSRADASSSPKPRHLRDQPRHPGKALGIFDLPVQHLESNEAFRPNQICQAVMYVTHCSTWVQYESAKILEQKFWSGLFDAQDLRVRSGSLSYSGFCGKRLLVNPLQWPAPKVPLFQEDLSSTSMAQAEAHTPGTEHSA